MHRIPGSQLAHCNAGTGLADLEFFGDLIQAQGLRGQIQQGKQPPNQLAQSK